MTTEEVFAERLTKALEERQMMKKDFAKEVGYDKHSIIQWTTAKRLPRGEAIIAICTTLGVSADWLLGLDEE